MPRRRVEGSLLERTPTPEAAVFALLVVLTLAAFAWSQRLKRDPLVLDRVSFVAVPRLHPQTPPLHAFTPNHDCRYDRIRIRFRITRSDEANVQVVKPGGRLILTLARDVYLKRYHFFTYYWDGRARSDGLAPPGRYKLRVKLLGQERTLVPGGAMRLHRAKRAVRGECARGALGGDSATKEPSGERSP